MGTLPLIQTKMTVRSLLCLLLVLLVFSALVAAHHPPSTCLTRQNNQCKFPFRYRGRLFNECTTYNSENGKAWCTTQSGQYEDCRSSCPGVHVDDRSLCTCIHPFQHLIYILHLTSYKPDVTCSRRKQPFCYVDCNSDCRDLKPAPWPASRHPSKGRCTSRVACDTSIPAYDPRL